MNDLSLGVYSTDSNIRFKTTMLKSSLNDYGGAYILAKGTTIVTERMMKEMKV